MAIFLRPRECSLRPYLDDSRVTYFRLAKNSESPRHVVRAFCCRDTLHVYEHAQCGVGFCECPSAWQTACAHFLQTWRRPEEAYARIINSDWSDSKIRLRQHTSLNTTARFVRAYFIETLCLFQWRCVSFCSQERCS